MNTPLFPRRQTRPDLRPGQAVHVNAHAAWLPATVISVAHTAIAISLAHTSGLLTRTVAPWVVQPADGYQLARVATLRRGDQVVAADGAIHTVTATPWRGRDGWWMVRYDNGTHASLPPAATLRLIDHTPAVDVRGTRLCTARNG